MARLFNSVGQIVASLQFAAQQFQQPLTDAAAKNIIGLGLPEVAQRLFPEVPELHAKRFCSAIQNTMSNIQKAMLGLRVWQIC